MRIVITGADGFIGRNLTFRLRERAYGDLIEITPASTADELRNALRSAQFVFHLAGVNRPRDVDEFARGNTGYTEHLCAMLNDVGSKAPVVFSSSTQATLDNPYGRSKRAAEDILLAHSGRSGAPVHVFRLTNGQGPDWTRVSDLGRTLDPENPLYQPGGRPAVAASATAAAASTAAFASTLGAATAPATPTGGPDSVLPDLDLDLDLDLHEAPSAPAPAPSTFAMAAANNTAAAAPVVSAAQAPVPSLDLGDLELPQASWDEPAVTPQTTSEPDVQSEPLPLNLDDDLSLMDSGVAPLTSRDAKAATSESLEFDLGDLSLDLDTPTAAAPVAPSVAAKAASSAADALPDDPLATKLALAEEFNTIGDSEGARALVEEVIAESSGELKARAQRLLAELG